MATAQIRVQLNLDDATFTSGFSRAGGTVTAFRRQLDLTVESLARTEDRARSAGTTIAGLSIAALGVEAAFGMMRRAFEDTVGSIIKTNAEIERTKILLEGLSKADNPIGRKQDAQTQFDWLKDFATQVPFSLKTIQDAFVKLKTVGMDPMDGSLQGLTNAVAAFGGSSQQLEHATLAVQQMMGKGVISMEELRRQLGEAVPNAINQMAAGMGLTYGELVAKVSKGSVESASAVQKMLAMFNLAMGNAAQNQMKTFTGMLTNVEVAWRNLQQAAGESGFFDEVKQGLGEVLTLLNGPAATQFAKLIGQELTDLTVAFRTAITTVAGFASEIKNVAIALGALFVAQRAAALIAGLGQSFLGAAQIIRQSFTTAMQTYQVAAMQALQVTQYWNAGGMQLAQTLGAASGMVAGFARAAVGLAGPLGMAVVAVYSIAEALGLFTDKAKEAQQQIVDGFITERNVKAIKDRLEQIDKQIAAVKERATAPTGADETGGGALANALLGEPKKKLADLMVEQQALLESLKVGNTELARRASQGLSDAAMTGLNSELQTITNAFNVFEAQYKAKIEALAKAGKGENDPERQALKSDFANEAKASYDKQLAIVRAFIQEKANLVQVGSDQEKAAATKELADALELEKRIAAQRKQADVLGDPNAYVANQKGLSKIQQQIERYKEQVAEAQALMAGLGKEQAKVATQLSNPDEFKNATDADKQSLKEWAAAADDALKLKEAWQKAQTKDANATSQINKQYDESQSRLAAVVAEMRAGALVPDPLGIVRFNASLDEMKNNLVQTNPELVELFDKAEKAKDLNASAAALQQIAGLAQKTAEIRAKLTEGSAQRSDAEMQAEFNRLDAILQKTKLTDENRALAEKDLQAYIAAKRDEFQRQNENALQKTARDWKDSSKEIGAAATGWANSALDALVNFAKTGKLAFSDFAISVLADIAKIEAKAALSPLLKMIGDAAFNYMMPGAGASQLPNGASDPGALSVAQLQQAHTGGVIGRDSFELHAGVDPSVFRSARRFHTGGFPGGTGLSSNEVPTILKKDEGVFTPEQMRALGRGAAAGGQPEVTVNVINQTGQQVDANQSKPRFDGRQIILDVVLKAAGEPGSFRDGMKAAITR